MMTTIYTAYNIHDALIHCGEEVTVTVNTSDTREVGIILDTLLMKLAESGGDPSELFSILQSCSDYAWNLECMREELEEA
jgi:hypothetical protein